MQPRDVAQMFHRQQLHITANETYVKITTETFTPSIIQQIQK